MADTDLKVAHAKQFTEREIKTLAWWLIAANEGAIGSAGRILSTGLLAEHYSSLLEDDPVMRSTDEQQILAGLEAEADAAIDSFHGGGSTLPAPPGYNV